MSSASRKVNRPVTVAVAQAALIFFAVLLLFGLLVVLGIVAWQVRDADKIVGTIPTVMLIVMVMLVLWAAFRGLVKGKRYGRWLAVACLIFVWSVLIYVTVLDFNEKHAPQDFWQFVGSVFFEVILHGGFLFLIMRLAFSKKVNRFFTQPADANGNGLH